MDEEHTESAWPILDLVTRDGATVPVVWRFEIANGLLMAERRGRITADQRTLALAHLSGLPIAIDRDGPAQAWRDTLDIANRYRLTLYDAAYLEAAARLELPLATYDNALRAAARSAAVPSLPA